MSDLEMFIDGACRGNPGPSSIGVVIRRDGKILKQLSQSIGEGTNNIAEYRALIAALEQALELKAARILIHTDSELLFHQTVGNFKVKSPHLRELLDRTRQLTAQFDSVEIKRIPREQNKEADALASGALRRNRISEDNPAQRGRILPGIEE